MAHVNICRVNILNSSNKLFFELIYFQLLHILFEFALEFTFNEFTIKIYLNSIAGQNIVIIIRFYLMIYPQKKQRTVFLVCSFFFSLSAILSLV